MHWAVYHTRCIIRQRSCQAERPLVYLRCGVGLRGGGGEVMFFLHSMLFPTFLEQNNSGNKLFFFGDTDPANPGM